jgi:hypothetical protein
MNLCIAVLNNEDELEIGLGLALDQSRSQGNATSAARLLRDQSNRYLSVYLSI